VGFDAASAEFLVRNPAGPGPGEERVGAAALDAARRAFGTDEDLLVVGGRTPEALHGLGLVLLH
jgi:hypothetical protein